MKIWTLVWFLVYPPIDGTTTWEQGMEKNLTSEQCFELLVDKDIELKILAMDNKIIGHELYCKKED